MQQLPKVTPMPPPPPPQARPNRNTEATYAEEAMRAAQRHIDQVQEIDRLGQELEEWRRRAMLAEAEIKRLEKRETDLLNMLERRSTELTDERDSYRGKLNHLVAQFHTAGAVILKCLEAAQGSAGPQINLTNLAAEIEREQAKEAEPMPRVVTAGPEPQP